VLQLTLRKVLIGREFYPGRRATFKRIPGIPPQVIVYFCNRSTAYVIFIGHLAALLLGWMFPGICSMRILVFLAFSCFSILDAASINTASYPSLYVCAAMAFMPARNAEAIGAAATMHFFVAAGLSKLAVGGIKWMHPLTMRSYIRMVHEMVDFFKRVGMYKCDIAPGCPNLSKYLITLDAVTVSLAFTTVFFEILVVPLSFYLRADTRLWTMVIVCLSFHLGIAALQSVWVGMCFIPCFAFYMYGFGHPHVNSISDTCTFWSGVVFGFQSVIYYILTYRILPSKWPLNPIALYALSGPQFEHMLTLMVKGNSRLALTLGDMPQDRSPVLSGVLHESLHDDCCRTGIKQRQFDAFQNCANFTVFNHDFFLAMHSYDWDPLKASCEVTRWLRSDRLICEGVTGQLLRTAGYIVIKGSILLE